MSQPARRVLQLLRSSQWACPPATLELLAGIAERTTAPDFEAVLARRGERLAKTQSVVVREGVAVLPIIGPIFRRANLFTDISGASSIDVLARDFDAALNDPKVGAILLELDSPGGMVNGTSEFASHIRAASALKPVIAYVGGVAASAAYYLASAASRIVVSSTAILGSIGVVSTFITEDDPSVVEVVSSQSPNKRLDIRGAQGRAQAQAVVDALAEVFISDVAQHRGTTPEKVKTDFGAGGVLVGAAAVRVGMADAVGTLEEVIARYATAAGSQQEQAQRAPRRLTLIDAMARARAEAGPFAQATAIEDRAVALIKASYQ